MTKQDYKRLSHHYRRYDYGRAMSVGTPRESYFALGTQYSAMSHTRLKMARSLTSSAHWRPFRVLSIESNAMTTTKTLRTIISRESTRLIDDWFNFEDSLSVEARRLAGRVARLNEISGLSSTAARWRMRATGTYCRPSFQSSK